MCHIDRSQSLKSKQKAAYLTESLRLAEPVSPMRLSPFRRVAKTARINLNKYWGLLSQRIGSPALPEPARRVYTREEKENRLNEMIEAAQVTSRAPLEDDTVSQNSLNSIFEEQQRWRTRRNPPQSFVFQNYSVNSDSPSSPMSWSSSSHCYCPSCQSCPSCPTTPRSPSTPSIFRFPQPTPSPLYYQEEPLHSTSVIII